MGALHNNAITLGIDLSKIQIIILSHGHYDHTDAACLIPDLFPDELVLWFNSTKGLVILTGCCHAGIRDTCEMLRMKIYLLLFPATVLAKKKRFG